MARASPRVCDCSTSVLEALSGAKTTGEEAAKITWSNSRKRAFRRAKRRAEQMGRTWYRGQWRSAASLGTSTVVTAVGTTRMTPSKPPPGRGRRRRLQAISYNMGGMTQESYDLFKDWLRTRCRAEIVIVQETHWGLGREDGRWTLPGLACYLHSGWPATPQWRRDLHSAGALYCRSNHQCDMDALPFVTRSVLWCRNRSVSMWLLDISLCNRSVILIRCNGSDTPFGSSWELCFRVCLGATSSCWGRT